jgi:hypothetical protein
LPVYLVKASRVAGCWTSWRAWASDRTHGGGRPLVARMNGEIARVRGLVQPYRAPRVLYVLWPDRSSFRLATPWSRS